LASGLDRESKGPDPVLCCHLPVGFGQCRDTDDALFQKLQGALAGFSADRIEDHIHVPRQFLEAWGFIIDHDIRS
jgi:hypothetical protein